MNDYLKKTFGLGTVKDLLHDLKSDILSINSFEEFKKRRQFLYGWINSIEFLLGLKEEKE